MESVDERFREAGERFLRGDLSVPDFTYAVRDVTTAVVAQRPLRGKEVTLDALLEEWEQAGWDDRAAVVDRLRSLCRRLLDQR